MERIASGEIVCRAEAVVRAASQRPDLATIQRVYSVWQIDPAWVRSRLGRVPIRQAVDPRFPALSDEEVFFLDGLLSMADNESA